MAAASAAAALALVAVGCVTPPPEAVLHVPGSYTAELTEPLPWGPSASVLMCLDEASAVRLTNPPGHPGIGAITLRWSGAEYQVLGDGEAVELTTPVLQPGCGPLTFTVDCCHVDEQLTIEATKVP